MVGLIEWLTEEQSQRISYQLTWLIRCAESNELNTKTTTNNLRLDVFTSPPTKVSMKQLHYFILDPTSTLFPVFDSIALLQTAPLKTAIQETAYLQIVLYRLPSYRLPSNCHPIDCHSIDCPPTVYHFTDCLSTYMQTLLGESWIK